MASSFSGTAIWLIREARFALSCFIKLYTLYIFYLSAFHSVLCFFYLCPFSGVDSTGSCHFYFRKYSRIYGHVLWSGYVILFRNHLPDIPALVWRSVLRLQSCQQVVDNLKKMLLRQSVTHLTQILLCLCLHWLLNTCLLWNKPAQTKMTMETKWKIIFISKHPMKASPAPSTITQIISFCKSTDEHNHPVLICDKEPILCVFPALEIQHDITCREHFKWSTNRNEVPLGCRTTEQSQHRWRLGFRRLGSLPWPQHSTCQCRERMWA